MPDQTIDELRVQAQAIVLEIDELTAIDDPSDKQLERLDELTTQGEDVRGSIEAAEERMKQAEVRAARVEELRGFARKPGYTEGPTLVTTNHTDPYDLSNIRAFASPESKARELSARAHDAVVQAPPHMTSDQRETAMRHVDNDVGGNIAQHYLEHGSAEYYDGFVRYLSTGQMEQRAALSTTGANGGYLIPFHLDPTVIFTNTGTVNPFRAISKVATIATNVWHGVSSAGASVEWAGQAAEVTDASPTFVQPAITPQRADVHITASREVLEDTGDLAATVASIFADARDRGESAAFATGTGTNQPFGIRTALQLVTASRVAANTNAVFGAVDVFALVNALPARYQDNCVWVAHWWLFNLARQFGGANQPNFWVDLGPGIPSQLLGRSTYQSSLFTADGGGTALSTATASNDDVLILGDFGQGFQIVDRIGMEVLFNPLVIGASALRPTGQVSWTAFWRVGSDVVNADAFRMLRI